MNGAVIHKWIDMNRKELIDALADKTGSTKADADRNITALTEIISSAQKRGDDVACFGRWDQRLDDALEEVHKKWFDYETRSLKPEYAEIISCPVCGSGDSKLYFEKDYFYFAQCKKCSMVFLNPRPNVEAAYEFYNSPWTTIYFEQKFLGSSDSVKTDNLINQANIDLIERHHTARRMSKGSLLEIGIGGGYFLRVAKRAGYNVWGIDIGSESIEQVATEFGGQVKNCDLFSAGFESEKFDVVYMRDVFEHVPNPKLMLDEINRISKEGATLYIEVPNINGLIYKLVGKRHDCVFGFEHLNYWSPKTIARILDGAGYNVDEIVHISDDCTITAALRYFKHDTFTTVFKSKRTLLTRATRRLILGFLDISGISRLDRAVMPKLATFLKQGATIKVIATKRSSSSVSGAPR